MTQDEIIRMAREAGIGGINGVLLIDLEQSGSPELERFAMLIREACAKVCEDYIDRLHEMRDNDESLPQYQPELAGRQAGAGRCAAAIRARGENVC